SLLLLAMSCQDRQPSISAEDHRAQIEEWHSKRMEELKGSSGWLNLAGLFWLRDGMNTFGSSEDNDVVFPSGKIDEHAGYFMVKNGMVTLQASSTATVSVNGSVVTDVTVFYPDSAGN